MRSGDGGAEVAKLVADELPVLRIEVDDAQLLQADHISENPARVFGPQSLVGRAKGLDDATNGRFSAITAEKARAHVRITVISSVKVKSDVLEVEGVVKLVHQCALVLLVEEYVAKTCDGQVFLTGFLKAAKGAAFGAKRLRVVVEGLCGFEIVGVLVATPPILTDKAELRNESAIFCRSHSRHCSFAYELQRIHRSQDVDFEDERMLA